MAPEYAMEGLFSVKSDVFSFGVLMLEILSGKRNNRIFVQGNAQSLLAYVRIPNLMTYDLWYRHFILFVLLQHRFGDYGMRAADRRY